MMRNVTRYLTKARTKFLGDVVFWMVNFYLFTYVIVLINSEFYPKIMWIFNTVEKFRHI
jgi:hypothetical protein